ncbi:MAG: hypothetical protein LBV71_09785 [Prevotella sp.]|nr:hypothetical protein [Prevotella sp.]
MELYIFIVNYSPRNCDRRERFSLRQSRSKVGNVYISITLPLTFQTGLCLQPDGQHLQELIRKTSGFSSGWYTN